MPRTVSGSIEGVVRFHGEIPKSLVTDDAGIRRELLQVDSGTRGLSHVVAYLTPVNVSSNEPSLEPLATMDQRDYEFVPRVLAVRSGQPVRFTNSDSANHNVRTSSPNRTNEFNVFTGVEGSYTHRFTGNPEQRPIRLGCDIHPWMRGWIYVFEHSHFAVTDGQGRFRINSVPLGRYKLFVQQPDIRHTHERTVVVSNAEPISIEHEIQSEGISGRIE